MKKKIVILGSTGSIGQNTLKIIRSNKKNFQIVLLSTNKNINKIFQQAKEFKVKNIIINDYEKFLFAKKKFAKNDLRIFNSFKDIDRILNKKRIYYSMISLTGLDGLKPTLQMIKYSQNLAIVNKESLICGWNLIQKALIKYNTKFIPVDSEHFSIFSLIKNNTINNIEKIYITASGGPFINLPINKFNKIQLKDALKHPNWKMGKKITIDSATMMNKVFEVIEAKNIFKLNYNQIEILTHPKSYIHAIIEFKNGLSKFLAHKPDMKIPIHNSLYSSNKKYFRSNSIDLEILNDLEFKRGNIKKFPLVKLLNILPNRPSLFETVLITINDYLVFKFLDKKINFSKLVKLIYKISNRREFLKYKKIKPKNVEEIYSLRNYVSMKMDSLGI